jgi:hypothetical protein
MRVVGGKGTYLQPLVGALEAAGYQITSGRKNKHIRMAALGRPTLILPRKFDDPILAKRIAKLGGVILT